MKNFLAIGEVCKIKGVTHRMLRYYDKLGILVPAYINEQTNYRYYSKSQMIILDLILVCTDLEIPLSEINKFILTNETYDIEGLLEIGNELATKKLQKIENSIYKINSIKNNLNTTHSNYKGVTARFINERFFIVDEFDINKFSLENYWESVSVINKKIIDFGFTPSINQGQLFLFSEENNKLFTYIEIDKPKTIHNDIMIISSGIYECEIFQDEEFEHAKEKYFKNYTKGTILIISDVVEKYISNKIPPFEVQILKK